MSEVAIEPAPVAIEAAAKLPRPPRKPRRWTLARAARTAKIVGGVSVVIAGAILVVPLVAMHRARKQATECLAKFPGPRTPALPECAGTIHDFERLASVSYTHHDATYRAEELWARIMVGTYENAAIGDPSPAALERSSSYVDEAQTVLEKGSQRISLEELGPAMAMPNLGKEAGLLGDRRTLIADYDWWGLWTVRQHAIQAALVEGKVDVAAKMAKRYADWDPRDADLRTTMGGVLCMGPDPQAGLELLTRIPNDRAEHRYAAMARNYGEVLGLLDACARKAKLDAPAPPASSSAGQPDVEETRVVERIRLDVDPKLLADDLDRAKTMLEEEGGLTDSDAPYARAYLLAALVARDAEAPIEPPAKPANPGDAAPKRGGGKPATTRVPPGVVANLIRPRGAEGPLAPEPRHVLELLLDEGTGLHPILRPETLASASAKLLEIADAPDPPPTKPPPHEAPKPAEDDVPDGLGPPKTQPAPREPTSAAQREEIRRASGALAFHAGIAAARFGLADLAVEQIDLAAVRLGWSRRTAKLVRGTAVYVAGDARRAAELLDGPTRDDDAPTEMEIAIVRSLSLASSGDAAGASRSVDAAIALVEKADDADLTLAARWLTLGLGPASPVAGAMPFPIYTGQADIARRWESLGAKPIDENLRAWSNALAASGPDRLAFRYALVTKGGDAPSPMIPYLLAGARLLDASTEGDAVEIWLDAMTAIDSRRVTLSAYAFARREAARIRGDGANALRWSERLSLIREHKSREDELEIARFLNF